MTQLSRLLLAGALLAGCAGPEVPEPVDHPGLERPRATRVNFRPAETWLHSSNFLSEASTLAAGSPATIPFYSSKKIEIEISGKKYILQPYPVGQAFPVDGAGIDLFLRKYFFDEGRRLDLDALGPPEFSGQVAAGTQAVGMTKEQVYTALGPPVFVGQDVPTVPLSYDDILRYDTWMYAQEIDILEPKLLTLYFSGGKLHKEEYPFEWQKGTLGKR